jgi:hypothetical protein
MSTNKTHDNTLSSAGWRGLLHQQQKLKKSPGSQYNRLHRKPHVKFISRIKFGEQHFSAGQRILPLLAGSPIPQCCCCPTDKTDGEKECVEGKFWIDGEGRSYRIYGETRYQLA